MSGEKTEKATPKKLQDLRKKGSAARSIELPSGVSLVALVVMLPSLVGGLFASMQDGMTLALSSAGTAELGTVRGLAGYVLTDASRAIAPAVAVVGITALVAGSVVTRSKPNPAVLKPQKVRLSPKASIKRIFSAHTAVELVKNVLKLVLLTAVTVGVWNTAYAQLLASGGSLTSLQNIASSASHSMLLRVAAIGLIIGVGDAWFQRHSFNKQAKMSHQDIKDEHKQSEGNPETKGQIRARQHAAGRSRMVEAVPKADVVLANPTHLVVALAYTPGSAAPVVVAKGAGAMADRIKALARDSGVPVLEAKPIARALYKATEVGDVIPVELFRAVAEVLAVVYAAKRRGILPILPRRLTA